MYFATTVSHRLTTPKGKVLAAGTHPARGDRLEIVQHDFAGTPTHHARRYGAVDQLRCTYTNATSAICDDVLTVSGSKIQAEHQSTQFAGPITSFAITGGTGKYRAARGLITATTLTPKTSTISVVVLAGRPDPGAGG